MLFIGPLYANYLDHTLPGQANFGGFNIGLIEKRNYIVVGADSAGSHG